MDPLPEQHALLGQKLAVALQAKWQSLVLTPDNNNQVP